LKSIQKENTQLITNLNILKMKKKIITLIMKKNKLFLLLLICSMASSVMATIHTVNAGSYYYSPSALTIDQGDTVKWINDGGNHDVNADVNSQTGSSFNNPVSFQSNTTNVVGAIIYTHIFTVPGTYSYDCSVGQHAVNGMTGVIVVNSSNSIYDIVSNSTDHTTLKTAIDACALDVVLSDPGSLTLFAPTDAAFNLLPAGTVTALLNDIPQLTDILKHHVVGASVMSGMLSNNQVVTTLLGTDVTVTINANGVFIDNAQVIVADILADNGVVHVIDAVLLTPTTTSVNNINSDFISEYLYSINILGEKIDRLVKNQIIFDIYRNGEVVKRFAR
jgi:uncharacterized surface protein with fasciclin (FAS1) repeats